MIEMGVAEDDRVGIPGRVRQRLPVSESKLLEALEEAAVEKEPAVADL
jgi:hypothetical protein